MSQQLNFFGDKDDLSLMVQEIDNVFGPSLFVPDRFRELKDAVRELWRLPEAFVSTPEWQLFAVVPKQCLGDLVFRPLATGITRVDMRESPVFEFSPPWCSDNGNTAHQGRIYCAYPGEEFVSNFKKLTARLRKRAASISHGHRYWVFPGAQRASTLVFFLGSSIVNPLLQRVSSEQM